MTSCDCPACGTVTVAHAVHPPSGRVGPWPAEPDSATERLPAPPAEPDCVGPIAIPDELTQTLRALSAAAGVDDFVPLWICASELVCRWSRGRRPLCAHLIRERREAIASPATGLADPGVSFLTALRRAGHPAESAHPAGSAHPADVTILVSQDGDRLYAERRTNAADSPAPWKWARSFLQLLSALAGMPSAPVGSHLLAEAAGSLPGRTPGVLPSGAAVP